MPGYVLTVAYNVENTEASTALISSIVAALDDAPSELSITQATVVDDAGTVEDLLGPEADNDTSSASSDGGETVGDTGSASQSVGDQPVAATPQGDEILGGAESLPPSDPEHPDEPATHGLPTGKEF